MSATSILVLRWIFLYYGLSLFQASFHTVSWTIPNVSPQNYCRHAIRPSVMHFPHPLFLLPHPLPPPDPTRAYLTPNPITPQNRHLWPSLLAGTPLFGRLIEWGDRGGGGGILHLGFRPLSRPNAHVRRSQLVPGGEGMYSKYFWVGVCHPVLKTLTLL